MRTFSRAVGHQERAVGLAPTVFFHTALSAFSGGNPHRSFLIFLILLAAQVLAQEPPAGKAFYKALGAPSKPKIPVQWNRYHDYGEITKIMHDLAKTFPEHCQLQSLGKTYGKRDMWVM